VEAGRIRAGLFAAPAGDANLLAAGLFQEGWGAAWRRKRLMEWFGYGLIMREWYLGMIIIDAKVLPISAVYAVNRRDRTTFSHDLLPGRVRVAANPWNDRSWARGPGYDLEFHHDLEEGRHELRLDLKRPGKPRVQGQLFLLEDMELRPSLNAVLPTRPPYFFYTHKACLPARGELEIGAEKIILNPGHDLANLDEHRNFAQTPAQWTWGTAAGYDRQGRLLAFNLGNTGGHDQESWNENCLWLDRRLELLGPVQWIHNRRDPFQPWTVTESHGRVQLTFTPDNGKIVSLPPLGRYYQMAGRYHGFVLLAQGERREINDLYGCAENGDIGW
jgi:hypothetical protein